MRRQRTAVDEFQKGRQRLLQGRRVRQHGVGDARQADDLRRQAALGVHEGLERVGDLAVFQHHRADLGDGLGGDLQSGSLDIEADDLVVKGLILPAVNSHAVVQIVDEVPLDAVENFDLPLGGVPRIGEGLRHAVVGDGDGGVAPFDGLLDDRLGVGQGVHVGHAGVEMQLHPLFRVGVLAALVAHLGDVQGPQLDILAVATQLHDALHPQPHAGLHRAVQRLGLGLLHVFADGDAALVVGHIEGQAPQATTPRLVQLGGKDLALQHDGAHLGVQLHHGDGLALDGLAHQDILRFLAGLDGAHHHPQLPQAVLLHQQLPHGLHRRVRQRFAGLDLQLHGALGPVQHAACHRRVMQHQPQLTGRHKPVKKIKKRYSVRHSVILFSVW